MKTIAVLAGATLAVLSAQSQISLSGGSYSQNFDYPALSYASSQGTNWTDNSTIAGWYAASSGSMTNYRVSSGGVNNGALYSFGSASLQEDRALGSLASGSYNGITYGVRLFNDTASVIDALTISYTGEQWRNGAPTTPANHSLAFSYRIDATAITSPDWANALTWIAVPSLNFTGPVAGGTAGGLDGNLTENRVVIGGVLTGLSMQPNQEIFLRWYDINDISNDHGLAIDDLTIQVGVIPEPSSFALLGLGLTAVLVSRRRK